MGLSIVVGGLADLIENESEVADFFLDQLADVNIALRENLILGHVEPRITEVWSAEGYGYSGLHALREVAGLIWQGLPIPKDSILTGESTPNSDLLFDAALSHITKEPSEGFFARIFKKKTPAHELQFLHLTCHSDAEGYYVPIDFELPIAPNVFREETQTIWPLGSVQQLKREIDTLVEALEIPANLKSQSDEMNEALDAMESSGSLPLWQVQPIASYTSLVLKEACSASLNTGAAISFA